MKSILDKQWTYQDYLTLNDDKQYQIIKGKLIMNAAPSSNHQIIISNLGYVLLNFVKKNDLGKIIFSPYDVILSDNVVVQPDILFISKDKLNLIEKRGLFGSPDLAIEVISPSSLKRDTEDKREIYQEYGIKEYWLVFPLDETIEILVLENNRYKVYDYASIEDNSKEPKVKSKLLEGLEIDLREIF